MSLRFFSFAFSILTWKKSSVGFLVVEKSLQTMKAENYNNQRCEHSTEDAVCDEQGTNETRATQVVKDVLIAFEPAFMKITSTQVDLGLHDLSDDSSFRSAMQCEDLSFFQDDPISVEEDDEFLSDYGDSFSVASVEETSCSSNSDENPSDSFTSFTEDMMKKPKTLCLMNEFVPERLEI